MADFSASFQSTFNSDSFKLSGPRVLTITGVELEKVGQGDQAEEKPVLRCKEDDRGLVMNKTRYSICTELFGSPDTEKWIGGKVEAFYDSSIRRPGGGNGGIGLRAPRGK